MLEHIDKLLSDYWVTFGYGVLNTLILAIVGTIGGLIIGVFVGQLRNLKSEKFDHWWVKIIKGIGRFFAWCYVTFFRGTPMMVQAIILFTLTSVWTNIPAAPFGLGNVFNGYMYCGLIIITINTGAYMSEIIKSGMNGVPKGQNEAARSLGLSNRQTLFGITLPQALRNSLPTIGNEYIVNVKDSSVLNVIGLTELYRSVKVATNRNYYLVEGYVIIAVIYLLLTLIASMALKLVENKLYMKEKVNWFGIRRSSIDKAKRIFKAIFSFHKSEIVIDKKESITPSINQNLVPIEEVIASQKEAYSNENK